MKSTTIIPIIGGLAIMGYIATQHTAPTSITYPVPIATPMVEATVAPAVALPVSPQTMAAKPTPTPLVFPTIVTTGPAYVAPVAPAPTPMVDNPNDGWNRWH